MLYLVSVNCDCIPNYKHVYLYRGWDMDIVSNPGFNRGTQVPGVTPKDPEILLRIWYSTQNMMRIRFSKDRNDFL